MPKRSIRSRRVSLYWAQGGLCRACGVPMWERSVESFEAYANRMEVETGMRPGRRAVRRYLVCTMDHYIPKTAGGKDADQRNVAMCGECNSKRGSQEFHSFLETRTAGYFERRADT